MQVNESVMDRYSGGAKEREAALCCPVDYDTSLLAMLPKEIVERDYGCGDPSRYVREGDVVLDLGSGGGKICYMAAQLVGPEGHVHGVDINDDMLALARKHQPEMAEKLGNDRVTFHKGYIQDLAVGHDAKNSYLAANPIQNADSLTAYAEWEATHRQEAPMIADNSVDLVVSNCVLNLVRNEDREQMIREIYRVLKPGGRVAISDIVSDEYVPEHLQDDGHLWSGCISGAYHELDFLEAFVEAGFAAVGYDKWDGIPWQVVEGIEFRSVTLTAVKGEGSECIDRGHAVMYKGPYSSVMDDEGHEFPRGVRIAVCERTFRFCTQGPMADDFIGIAPAVLKDPVEYCAPIGTVRHPAETKSGDHVQTIDSNSGSCC